MDYLIRELLKEEDRQTETEIPSGIKEKEDMLRGMMNVRPPKPVSEEYLQVQDAYLQQRLEDIGVTDEGKLVPVSSDERLVLWQGDITTLKADAIVNAANSKMLGCFRELHACIDNAIHSSAGLQLRNTCNRQMEAIRAKLGETYEQPVGIPMLTDAFNLPAKKIVHVVGPFVAGDVTDPLREQLAMCYRNTLMLCERSGLKSVAFCCISTGEFHFPNREAAEIAVKTVKAYLSEHKGIKRVIFNVFRNEDFEIYQSILQ